MLDIIQNHIDRFNASDWDAYKAALAQDVVYEEIATNTRVQGPDAYINTVQRWKRAFPDVRGTIQNAVIEGDKAVVELEWEGTHGGPLEGPIGTLPATNKKGRLRAVLMLRFANDKIVESRHYFDLFTLMSQLELAPRVGTARETVQPTAAPRH